MEVESRGELNFLVAVLAKSLLEELVGQDACFWKSIYAYLDFEIDILVVDDIAQVVFSMISSGCISIFKFMYLGLGNVVLR